MFPSICNGEISGSSSSFPVGRSVTNVEAAHAPSARMMGSQNGQLAMMLQGSVLVPNHHHSNTSMTIMPPFIHDKAEGNNAQMMKGVPHGWGGCRTTNVPSSRLTAPPHSTLPLQSQSSNQLWLLAEATTAVAMATGPFLPKPTVTLEPPVTQSRSSSAMAKESATSDATAMSTKQLLVPVVQPQNAPLFCLSCPDTDSLYLSQFQVFLRLHIEAFVATMDDTTSHTRGRNKRIRLNQVGIRCRHCAHVTPSQRTKGSTYFPASRMGIYQAAQNMCSTHLQCGLCPEMPDTTKSQFAQLLATKTAATRSSGGRAYWGRCAQGMVHLVDTDHGIFPRGSIPIGVSLLEAQS